MQIYIKPTKLQLKRAKKQAKIEPVTSDVETHARCQLSASFLKSESKLLAQAEKKPKKENKRLLHCFKLNNNVLVMVVFVIVVTAVIART
jgi:hypothetical protein